MINLNDQIVVVTGGSRGIGRAAAILSAVSGANVALIYGSNRFAAETTAELIGTLGRKALTIRARVEKMHECRSAIKLIIRKLGKIDVLINSAGIWEFGKIGEISSMDWQRSINVNLTGTFNMCNSVIPYMKSSKYGRIINISSTAGQRGESFHSPYAASKGGIIAFTKSIASELIDKGIWVNCVAPGWVATDMISRAVSNKKKKTEIQKSIPRGKFATPEEIAGPILFLASNLADNIVGEVLNVNGGSVLCG